MAAIYFKVPGRHAAAAPGGAIHIVPNGPQAQLLPCHPLWPAACSLPAPQVPVEMVQFSDLVFGKLLGEGSGERRETGGHARAGRVHARSIQSWHVRAHAACPADAGGAERVAMCAPPRWSAAAAPALKLHGGPPRHPPAGPCCAAEGAVYAAWHRETPVAVKRTRSLMELEMNLHAGKCAIPSTSTDCLPAQGLPLCPGAEASSGLRHAWARCGVHAILACWPTICSARA